MAEAPPKTNMSSSLLARGSDSDFGISCQPCGYEGKNVEADGYCHDCCEYLCFSCYKCHKSMSMSRHHELVDKDRMPSRLDSVKVKDVCTERCQSHEDEIVKYFCPTHQELGCTVCVTLKHKQCEDAAYIPEVSKDLENSEDYKTFQTRLKNLMAKSENIITSAEDNTDILTDNYTKVLQYFEAYKAEIIQRLNELEDEIKGRIEEMKRSQGEKMASVSNTGTEVLEELRSMSAEFEALANKKQYCQMFTDMKNCEKKLGELEDKLREVEDKTATVFMFQSGVELRTVVRKRDAFGRVVVPADMELTHVADVNAKSRDNSTTCKISGATVLSEEKLVIADWGNDTIKLCDTVNNKILSEFKPGSGPWDVTTVSQDLVAATLPVAQKVVLVRCRDELALDREIKVNCQCCGIDCAKDRLFVTYDNHAKVEILTLSGQVLQSFTTNGQGDQLFINPKYVCVSTDKQSIYVSDWAKRAVIQLGMDGHVMAEYKDDQLRSPSKMAVDSTGLVYLCGEDSHNTHLLTPQCRKVKILLEEKDGLRDPRSVCYLEATGRLYIGMYKNDTVKVYQVNFFDDHTKIILSYMRNDYFVTYIDEDRKATTYSMVHLIQDGCLKDIMDRMCFGRAMLKNLVDIEGVDI